MALKLMSKSSASNAELRKVINSPIGNECLVFDMETVRAARKVDKKEAVAS